MMFDEAQLRGDARTQDGRGLGEADVLRNATHVAGLSDGVLGEAAVSQESRPGRLLSLIPGRMR